MILRFLWLYDRLISMPSPQINRFGVVDKRKFVDFKEKRKPRRMMLSSKDEVIDHDSRALGDAPEGRMIEKLWVELGPSLPLREMPLEIMIESVGAVCNMHCPMCYLQDPRFDKQVRAKLLEKRQTIMPWDLSMKIINEIKDWNLSHPMEERILSVKFGFRGEPTMDRKILEKANILKKECGVYFVSFLTNALIMDDEFFKKAIEYDINEIVFSGEGFEKEMYETVRSPGNWDEFIGKLGRFKKMRDKMKKARPAMRIQSVWPAIKANPAKFYEVFKDRVDMVVSNALIDYLHNDDRAEIKYIKNFKCYEPFQRIVIASDGGVLQCINDEYSNNILGEVANHSIYDVWHAKPYNDLRASHMRGTGVVDYQKTCGNCYLPRQIEWSKPVKVDGRTVEVFKYRGRAQILGQ